MIYTSMNNTNIKINKNRPSFSLMCCSLGTVSTREYGTYKNVVSNYKTTTLSKTKYFHPAVLPTDAGLSGFGPANLLIFIYIGIQIIVLKMSPRFVYLIIGLLQK